MVKGHLICLLFLLVSNHLRLFVCLFCCFCVLKFERWWTTPSQSSTKSNSDFWITRSFKLTLHISPHAMIGATADCTHVGSATASFKDLVTIAQENTPTKQQMFVRGSATASFNQQAAMHSNIFECIACELATLHYQIMLHAMHRLDCITFTR